MATVSKVELVSINIFKLGVAKSQLLLNIYIWLHAALQTEAVPSD